MAGNKTHEQQLRIIEKRENTANADKDFDPKPDLRKSEALREAEQRGASLKTDQQDLVDPDDRNILRGKNQESEHRKDRPDN